MKCGICGDYASGWDLEMNSKGEFEFRCNKHRGVNVDIVPKNGNE